MKRFTTTSVQGFPGFEIKFTNHVCEMFNMMEFYHEGLYAWIKTALDKGNPISIWFPYEWHRNKLESPSDWIARNKDRISQIRQGGPGWFMYNPRAMEKLELYRDPVKPVDQEEVSQGIRNLEAVPLKDLIPREPSDSGVRFGADVAIVFANTKGIKKMNMDFPEVEEF